jgi:hypothetical protein
MSDGDPDLVGRLLLHFDVDVRVVAVTDLHDREAGSTKRRLK